MLSRHTCRDGSKVSIVLGQYALSKFQQVGWQHDRLGWVPSGVEENASAFLCCKLHMQISDAHCTLLFAIVEQGT